MACQETQHRNDSGRHFMETGVRAGTDIPAVHAKAVGCCGARSRHGHDTAGVKLRILPVQSIPQSSILVGQCRHRDAKSFGDAALKIFDRSSWSAPRRTM